MRGATKTNSPLHIEDVRGMENKTQLRKRELFFSASLSLSFSHTHIHTHTQTLFPSLLIYFIVPGCVCVVGCVCFLSLNMKTRWRWIVASIVLNSKPFHWKSSKHFWGWFLAWLFWRESLLLSVLLSRSEYNHSAGKFTRVLSIFDQILFRYQQK